MLFLVRSYDIVMNRNHSPWTFGTGLGWQLPRRAVEFIERENLPGEIFNTYNEGGYMVWSLGPRRRDYLDGRALPFGQNIFRHESILLQSSLDSDTWQQEADHYNINTIILPLNRFESALGALKNFCNSTDWRPVYLDEVSVVFVRRKPETENLIRRFPVDCSTAPLPAEAVMQSRGGDFNQWANAAGVLAALGRNPEALAAAEKARLIAPDNSYVPWIRGNIYTGVDSYSQAEREYLKAISLEPNESLFWFSLAILYKHEEKILEAIQAQQRAIKLSSAPEPHELIKLAGLYLETEQPKAALKMFDKAMQHAPPDLLSESGARSFKYNVAMGRAAAWRALGDTKRAAAFDQEAVQDLVPQ